jgi:predicted CxxxxCH...CXXCH cytochrome family protein
LSGLAEKFNRNAVCGDCHKGYVQGTTTTADHIDGNVDVYFITKDIGGGVSDLGYPVDKVKGSALASCSTSNCHSNGKSTYASPTWGGTSTGCSFCHPNLSAGHAPHVGSLLSEITFYAYTSSNATGSVYKFGCSNCHPIATTNHMNGSVDVDLTANAAAGHLKANNGAGATINGSNECSNVYCHSNGLAPSFTFATTPSWGTLFTGDRCAKCHGNSPNSTIAGSGAHSAHVVGIHYEDIYNGVSRKLPKSGGSTVNAAHGRNNRSTTINCNVCHAVTVTSSANDDNTVCAGCHNGTTAPKKNSGSLIANATKHVNGNVDVVFVDQKIASKAQVANTAFAGYTANSYGWTRNNNIYKTYTSGYDVSKNTLYASAGAYNSSAGCLNIACHNGITVKWTDVVTCTSCHVRLK